MKQPVIAKEYRAGHLENTHQGIICAIDEDGKILYEKGDINQFVFYRSAMKPIQAIPAVSAGIIEKYQLTKEEATLLTASQRGESYHEEALKHLREKLSVNEEELVCGASYPLNDEPKESYLKSQKDKRKLMHNCAGKHLGLYACAREKGYPTEGYENINHPLQQEILTYVSDLSETKKEDILSGTDGCGVAVHSLPLKNIATSYLKFACPDLIENEDLRNTVKTIGNLMNAHPEIVASHDFVCTALLKDDNIIAKGGAQGVYGLALKKERIAISLKVLSGSELLWPVLIAQILERLNYSNEKTIKRLYGLNAQHIYNDDGKVIGERKIYL